MATVISPQEWVELPPNGKRCPIFGLPLTTMRRLTCPQVVNDFKPPVKSKLVKFPGARRGRRMVDCASMRAWLASLPDADTIREEDEE